MPVGLHVLLMHWKDQDEAVPLPDLLKTEETGEGNNKFSQKFREDHARKDNRVHTMTDVFHRLCEAGDVLVSSISAAERDKRRKMKNLPPEVISFLEAPKVDTSSDDLLSEDDEETEENEGDNDQHVSGNTDDDIFELDEIEDEPHDL